MELLVEVTKSVVDEVTRVEVVDTSYVEELDVVASYIEETGVDV